MPTLDPRTTALVLIDLQRGVVGMPVAPYSGPDVVERSKGLIAKFRAAGAPIVLVTVGFAPDGGDMLKQPVDKPSQLPKEIPAEFLELVDGLAAPGDLRVVKHNWGAFYGTDLDVQLRRRGIQTIVLGGIATSIGVESTARAAHEHNYALVLVEDACSCRSAEMHAHAVQHIFPSISRVVKAADVQLQA